MMLRAPLVLVAAAVAVVGALLLPGAARAELDAERQLAETYAPVVRLVDQREACAPGEPFEPIDVNLLFGNREVAFRGPWNPTDLVTIGPKATDLSDRFEYHLDFPGDALDPGCVYDEWSKRVTEGHTPAVYAHVARQQDAPGRLALQYWFFYLFNDFNNTHEGDWEMLQLVFDADTPEEALRGEPVEVGYSAHEGAERARWGDDKLELVDGTHPVAYPAAGSHANKFTPALYLGSSASAGVGCDDTRGPHRELRPTVLTIPSDPAAAREAFPWTTFEGRWGELQKAFFNGPTGPNLKTQWREPITWMDDWRDSSLAVPTGGVLGTSTTDFFCSAVETGSRGLVQLLRNPLPVLLALGVVLGLLVLLAVKATWTPTTPRRLAHRRTWGQILSASGSLLLHRPRLFFGIGLLLIPLGFVIALIQWALFRALELVGLDITAETAGSYAYVAVVIGVSLTLLGLGLVQAATACAVVELDAGREVGTLGAYRLALRRLRPLLRAIAVFVAVLVLLSSTTLLMPLAAWLAVRWALIAPVVEIEGLSGLAALRRSGALVRRRWLRVASLVGLSALAASLAGPLLGALLVFVVDAPLSLLNIVAGLVYAATMPFVGLVTTLVYVDARVRSELDQRAAVDALPAEIALG
jgi:hypothetical protein